jgi:hypothetical protein
MFVILADVFSLCFSLALHAGETKVNSPYSSIKPGNLLPPYLSDHQERVNLVTMTYSFEDVAPVNWENQGQRPAPSSYYGT